MPQEQDEISRLIADLAGVMAERDEARADLSYRLDCLQQSELRLDILRAECDEARTQYASAKSQIDSMCEALENNEAALAAEQAAHQQTRAELAAEKEAHRGTKCGFDAAEELLRSRTIERDDLIAAHREAPSPPASIEAMARELIRRIAGTKPWPTFEDARMPFVLAFAARVAAEQREEIENLKHELERLGGAMRSEKELQRIAGEPVNMLKAAMSSKTRTFDPTIRRQSESEG